jgi:hypothetical protein
MVIALGGVLGSSGVRGSCWSVNLPLLLVDDMVAGVCWFSGAAVLGSVVVSWHLVSGCSRVVPCAAVSVLDWARAGSLVLQTVTMCGSYASTGSRSCGKLEWCLGGILLAEGLLLGGCC